jgi:hypothetical protein
MTYIGVRDALLQIISARDHLGNPADWSNYVPTSNTPIIHSTT